MASATCLQRGVQHALIFGLSIKYRYSQSQTQLRSVFAVRFSFFFSIIISPPRSHTHTHHGRVCVPVSVHLRCRDQARAQSRNVAHCNCFLTLKCCYYMSYTVTEHQTSCGILICSQVQQVCVHVFLCILTVKTDKLTNPTKHNLKCSFFV